MECPWCGHEVEILNGRCPHCRNKLHEVTEEDFEAASREEKAAGAFSDASLIEILEDKFKCAKCAGTDGSVKEVAMTGTGLSKLFDIQHHHFLFVSCQSCGFVEVYDPDVLQGMKTGKLSTVLDILFGH